MEIMIDLEKEYVETKAKFVEAGQALYLDLWDANAEVHFINLGESGRGLKVSLGEKE